MGSAFNCAESDNEILLLHQRFRLDGAFGTYNNGTIVTQSIRVQNGSYTSQLSVNVSDDVIGKTIECAYDSYINGTAIGNTVGSFTVPLITGMLIAGQYFYIKFCEFNCRWMHQYSST